MTYSAVYCALISKRLQTQLPDDEYGEVHHIIPKSEGGTNDKDNLVRLSAKEHYIAHLLLAKIYNDSKMWCALFQMSNCKENGERNYIISSRNYQMAKINFSKHVSSWARYKRTDETREKIRRYALNMSDEHRANLSRAATGRKLDEKTKEKLRLKAIGLHWFNNGIKTIRARECPEGFVAGRICKWKRVSKL